MGVTTGVVAPVAHGVVGHGVVGHGVVGGIGHGAVAHGVVGHGAVAHGVVGHGIGHGLVGGVAHGVGVAPVLRIHWLQRNSLPQRCHRWLNLIHFKWTRKIIIRTQPSKLVSII